MPIFFVNSAQLLLLLLLLLLLYGATNHWSGWVDGLARCITPVVADILSKDLDFRR